MNLEEKLCFGSKTELAESAFNKIAHAIRMDQQIGLWRNRQIAFPRGPEFVF